MGRAELVDWADVTHALVHALRQSDKFLLAAIHGTAVDGGLEVTLHSDLRFAAADTGQGRRQMSGIEAINIADTARFPGLSANTKPPIWLVLGR